MEKQYNQHRLAALHQMLFEMARGNFSNRIPLSLYDDELETLVVLVNMVAEEMKETIFYSGYVNPHNTYCILTNTNLVLNKMLTIQSFSPALITLLGYKEYDLLGTSLQHFITPNSYEKLSCIQAVVDDANLKQRILSLQFITKDQLLIVADCSITSLINRDELILSFITSISQNLAYPIAEKNSDSFDKLPKSRKEDTYLIQKVYDYILAHLEEPLPSLKELARYFGTNEYKLKDGFRYFFKTSIYKFYTVERLKRAFLLIQETSIPLKNIASMNGFGDYPTFSKSFKKQFGVSPKEVPRTFN
ncbi:helix-turn-helix domain-containing protein [Flavobacterium ardleyense]|uniref:Helix-turn-helix domain-containing protein n=1 Tax=Flavobacterium ardleyense TaxID=2038737 RepID=A0ABW5ZBG1_9FLAO